MSGNKKFSFKDWAKTKTTVKEHFIIVREHSPVDYTKVLTETTEKQTEYPTTEINLRHSNVKHPVQPKNFNFPKRLMSGQFKVFEKEWFRRFPWLRYDEELDAAICFPCVKAIDKNMIASGNMGYAFLEISLQIRSMPWKKRKFSKHQA